MSEFDSKYPIVDETTPSNVPLRGVYKRSFAYYTILQRLPVILTQVIDQLSRDKNELAIDMNEERVKEDIKDIQGHISKLKYELQTDKPLMELTGNEVDKDHWNEFLDTLNEDRKTYFTSTWLYTECYMYRRLKSIFEQTVFMKNFDYFGKQKQNALTSSYESMINVTEHVNEITTKDDLTEDKLGGICQKLIKLCLWGNRCDLSISQGKEIKTNVDPFIALESLDHCILVDKTNEIWECMKQGRTNESTIIDFIQDNSGYEMFTDLLLADFLLQNNFAKTIRFHVKAIPWFISDVTPPDFDWTIETLKTHGNIALAGLGQRCAAYIQSGRFIRCDVDYFWTGPHEFYRMESLRRDLYEKLQESHLLIFKGDLNYRKLLGDFNWAFTSSFEEVLRGFMPTNLCSLRTVKADLICELKDGVADEMSKVDPMWMETGQYGVIHFLAVNQS